MSNINSVNNIIEHIDNLSYDGRHGELKKELAYRLGAEKFFILLHIYDLFFVSSFKFFSKTSKQ